LCRDTIVSEQDRMIEDLDVIVEPRPTLRERWLLPAIGMIAVTAVLVSVGPGSKSAPFRGSVINNAPPRQSILSNVVAARPFRALELPRTIAQPLNRAPFSGVTGLSSAALSEGFRDLYRLPDGRSLTVIAYPDRVNGTLTAPASGPSRPVTIRGTNGQVYPMDSAATPLVVDWVADGMQYQVGGAGFTTDELLKLAEALR
jgi:hypothetical protein